MHAGAWIGFLRYAASTTSHGMLYSRAICGDASIIILPITPRMRGTEGASRSRAEGLSPGTRLRKVMPREAHMARLFCDMDLHDSPNQRIVSWRFLRNILR